MLLAGGGAARAARWGRTLADGLLGGLPTAAASPVASPTAAEMCRRWQLRAHAAARLAGGCAPAGAPQAARLTGGRTLAAAA